MTFEQFQATRKASSDLSKDAPDYTYDVDAAHTGFVYSGGLCIENVLAHWPQKTRDAGKYYLVLGNEEFISDDLASLEIKLFDYAVGEGVVD
jgi:hypothetical protein